MPVWQVPVALIWGFFCMGVMIWLASRIFRVGDQWMAEDLQSTNGSYVNDVPIQRSPLRDSDFLKIGNTSSQPQPTLPSCRQPS